MKGGIRGRGDGAGGGGGFSTVRATAGGGAAGAAPTHVVHAAHAARAHCVTDTARTRDECVRQRPIHKVASARTVKSLHQEGHEPPSEGGGGGGSSEALDGNCDVLADAHPVDCLSHAEHRGCRHVHSEHHVSHNAGDEGGGVRAAAVNSDASRRSIFLVRVARRAV